MTTPWVLVLVAWATPLSAVPPTLRTPVPDVSTTPSLRSLARPSRVWIHKQIRAHRSHALATDGRQLFLMRADRGRLVALDGASGRELWSASAKSSEVDWERSQVSVSGGLVLVKGSDARMAAFTVDGKSLWARKEPCDIEATAGPWAAVECHGNARERDEQVHLVDIKSGREARRFPSDSLHAFALSERALFTWSKEGKTMKKLPLVAGDSGWEVPTGLGFVATAYADSEVVVCVGREVRIFDAATGKLLWSKRPVGNHAGLSLHPLLHSNSVYLGMSDAIVAFDKRSGAEQRRYPLPSFLRLQPSDRLPALLVSWPRIVLLGKTTSGETESEVVATWTKPEAAPTVLARPLAPGGSSLLVGDLLVSIATYDRFVAGYSLTDLRPPLGDMPWGQAISVLEEDIAPVPRLSSLALGDVEPFARRRATDSSDDAPRGEVPAAAVCHPGVRKLPALQPGTPAGVFGTAHPIVVEAAAPDGRWVSVCQARRDTDRRNGIDVIFGHHGEALGDELEPYLIIGGGSGYLFDELIAHAPGGRYLAIREGPCLSLIDTVEGTSTILRDADLRDPERALGAHRAVSFDAVNGHVLYHRRSVNPGRERLVIRELATGQEREIDPGSGWVVRAELDPEGQTLLIDSTSDPRPAGPRTTLAARSCRGVVASYSVFGGKLPRIVHRIASTVGGPVREVPGLVRSFGKDLLIRAPDRSLWAESAPGKRRMIATAECDARVVHVDGPRRLVLYVCESEADRDGAAPISQYRDGRTSKLRAVDTVEEGDDWTRTTGRYAIANDRLIDLDSPDGPVPLSAYAGLGKEEGFIRSDGYHLVADKPAGTWGADTGPVRWVAPVAGAAGTDGQPAEPAF